MGWRDRSETPERDSPSPRYVEATQRSIALVEYLKDHGPATITELAEALEYSKSTVHRHVVTLEDAGYIVDSEPGYRIGLLYLDFGIHAQRDHELFELAKPKVDDLAEELGEKVWAMTEENGLSVFIYHHQGKHLFHTYTRVGYRGHMHAFAAGKAMLANMPREEVSRIIDKHGLPAYSDSTTTSREQLFEELDAIRDARVAFSREEAIEGVHAVAAPVLRDPEDPLGSICVTGPATRMNGKYFEDEVPDLLLGAANEIEVQLQYA